MFRRLWSKSLKRRCGSALIVLGVMMWALSAALPLRTKADSDVSISYFEGRSLGVIAGGGSVVLGIALLASVV